MSRGADMVRGDLLSPGGALLTPSRVGALAAVGLDRVTVYARPLVAILPTGNEVVPPGRLLPEASVYDVNSFTLAALVDRHGGAAVRFPPVRDTIDEVRAALDAVQNLPGASGAPDEFAADIVVFAGGSSVGERDVIVDGIRERGEIAFHGIAVKPGKPTLLATIGRQIVLGMPGNPTSCLSNAHVLLVPALRAAARLPALAFERRTCRLAQHRSLAARPASVPAGAHRWRRGDAGVQGIGRDHEPVARGRLRRDRAGGRGDRGGSECRRDVVLSAGRR